MLRTGAFSHLSTDHAPSTAEQKTAGDIWEAPFGLPGLDSTFPWLLDLALTGRLPLEKAVALYAEAPAQRYGLAPRKGRLEPGADADLVLIDPDSTFTLTTQRHLQGGMVAACRTYIPRASGGDLPAGNRDCP